MHAMADSTSFERRAQAGRWLRDAHESRGMNSAELARRLGVKAQTLSHWETGRYWVPDEAAREIAVILGMSEVEVRRGLGLYVPGELEGLPVQPTEIDTIAAIQRDV